jgi:demethylmenaquinone methyltransferase/2-methoxy-6-polyprenyl-1,4-benzoquinol methylase
MDPDAPEVQWDEQSLRDPHAAADKRRRVQRMFAAIAPSYDLNNRLHSLWQDQAWRRKAVKLANLQPTDTVVDVACGTGDLSLTFAHPPKAASPAAVWGVDYTFEMLPLAFEKYEKIQSTPAVAPCRFINGDAQALPLPDACCDVASIAFGIRNVVEPAAALREFRRILRPGGRLIILEFSLPAKALLRSLYNFYFRHILPRTATWISGDTTGAYKYLPQSVNTFIDRSRMVKMMQDAGFAQVEQFPMTFGVCVCYRGIVA